MIIKKCSTFLGSVNSIVSEDQVSQYKLETEQGSNLKLIDFWMTAQGSKTEITLTQQSLIEETDQVLFVILPNTLA